LKLRENEVTDLKNVAKKSSDEHSKKLASLNDEINSLKQILDVYKSKDSVTSQEKADLKNKIARVMSDFQKLKTDFTNSKVITDQLSHMKEQINNLQTVLDKKEIENTKIKNDAKNSSTAKSKRLALLKNDMLNLQKAFDARLGSENNKNTRLADDYERTKSNFENLKKDFTHISNNPKILENESKLPKIEEGIENLKQELFMKELEINKFHDDLTPKI